MEKINVSFTVTPEHVLIESASTVFCDVRPVPRSRVDAIMSIPEKVKLVRSLARRCARRVKLHGLKEVMDTYEANISWDGGFGKYMAGCHAAYDVIADKAKFLETRGIYMPCTDDRYVNELLRLKYSYERYFYAFSRLSILGSICDSLTGAVDRLYENLHADISGDGGYYNEFTFSVPDVIAMGSRPTTSRQITRR